MSLNEKFIILLDFTAGGSVPFWCILLQGRQLGLLYLIEKSDRKTHIFSVSKSPSKCLRFVNKEEKTTRTPSSLVILSFSMLLT